MTRRIALTATLLVLGTAAAAAQTPAPSASVDSQAQGGRHYAHQRLSTLLTGITLTVPQRGRVDSIMLRYQPDLPAGSPETNPDSSLVQRWAILLPRLDNEVRIVLTPDQQRVWDSNVEQWRNRRRGLVDR